MNIRKKNIYICDNVVYNHHAMPQKRILIGLGGDWLQYANLHIKTPKVKREFGKHRFFVPLDLVKSPMALLHLNGFVKGDSFDDGGKPIPKILGVVKNSLGGVVDPKPMFGEDKAEEKVDFKELKLMQQTLDNALGLGGEEKC